jgi:hypothetical protein
MGGCCAMVKKISTPWLLIQVRESNKRHYVVGNIPTSLQSMATRFSTLMFVRC